MMCIEIVPNKNVVDCEPKASYSEAFVTMGTYRVS